MEKRKKIKKTIELKQKRIPPFVYGGILRGVSRLTSDWMHSALCGTNTGVVRSDGLPRRQPVASVVLVANKDTSRAPPRRCERYTVLLDAILHYCRDLFTSMSTGTQPVRKERLFGTQRVLPFHLTVTHIRNPNWHIQSWAVATPPCMLQGSQGLGHNGREQGPKASERSRVEKGDQANNRQSKHRGELVVPKALR